MLLHLGLYYRDLGPFITFRPSTAWFYYPLVESSVLWHTNERFKTFRMISYRYSRGMLENYGEK